MTSTYEICGALSVVGSFRRNHAQQFAERLPASATVYCVTDAVTHSVMIRVRGALTDQEVTSIEGDLKEFSQKWKPNRRRIQSHTVRRTIPHAPRAGPTRRTVAGSGERIRPASHAYAAAF